MNAPHIVIVGAGFGSSNVARNFHDWNLSETRVILLEANDHLIAPYPHELRREQNVGFAWGRAGRRGTRPSRSYIAAASTS